MSELALWIVRTGFLAMVWVFIFLIISVIRSDIFGQKVVTKVAEANAPRVVSGPSGGVAGGGVAGTSVAGASAAGASAAGASAGGASAASEINGDLARHLVVTAGPRSGQSLRLDKRELTIGRSSDNDLQLNDEFTSTNHAKLVLVGDDWFLHDLDSTNGSFVAGTKVTNPIRVANNVSIRVGQTEFELRA